MTITSSMLGLCVPSESVPSDLGCFSDVAALYSGDRPSSISLSRGTIAALHLDRLLEAYEARGLFYLRLPVAVLDLPAIPQAIEALERLLAQIGVDSERALACALRECTAEQLVAAATGPEITPAPDNPQDEDGESLPHVIGYLKAHMVVLRHAHAHRLRVVHGHSHHLDGTDA